MPISVAELFDKIGLCVAGGVPWGEPGGVKKPGVYAICLSGDPTRNDGLRHKAPFSLSKIGQWIKTVPKIELDGTRQPEAEAVASFLKTFWLPNESILYIGETKAIRNRLGQLFKRKLGNPGKHAGGHWLQTLSDIHDLRVYFAMCATKQEAKEKKNVLLDVFSRQALLADKNGTVGFGPLPFANREGDNRKQGRFRNQCR